MICKITFIFIILHSKTKGNLTPELNTPVKKVFDNIYGKIQKTEMFPWSCRYLHFNALNYLSKTNVAGAPFSVTFPK